MKKRQKLLTDEQWELVEPMLPRPRRRRDNRGRPWASNRACFEAILWILHTGAAWRFLPDEFPSPSTCWRLKQWEDEGVWLNAWRTLLVGKCLSARSYACGSHAPRSLGSATQRPSATKTGKGDCRHRLRFGSVAPAIAETRDRVDRAIPGEQSATELRRWAQIAPLQAALDRRTNQLLAWPVPTLAGPP
jgi:transposase